MGSRSNRECQPEVDNGEVERPLLVLVCGAPGAGKSTLAKQLAPRLRLPLLMRDELQEVLYDTLGAPDEAAKPRYGHASYELLYTVARRLLEAGVGIVVESNFMRGWAEPQVAPLSERSRTVIVHCATRDAEETVRRYVERAERGERHPGHLDRTVVGRLRENLAAGRYEPMEIPARVIRVDTSESGVPEVEEIVKLIGRLDRRSVLGAGVRNALEV